MITLKAKKRELTGRKVKKLRREGILPANLYGKKIKSEAIEVSASDFAKVFKVAKETGLVELTINGSKKPVLIHNVQLDPVTDTILHVDFLQVDLKEKVVANVPIELVGESPVEKQGLGTVVQYLDEIEVESLPGDLPEKFEVDLGTLVEIDQVISVKDLSVDKDKVEIKADPEQIVVKVEKAKQEEEVIAEAPKEEAPIEAPTVEPQAEEKPNEEVGKEE